MRPYAIEIEGMNKRYGRTFAVRDLSMHVPYGSVYGFVGPNGAGKTTTIRTLATLERPDSGTIVVDGIDVQEDPSAVRARIGYMPDSSGVYQNLTVTEHLDFYAASHGIPAPRRRQLIEELLELVDLAVWRADRVKSLSRGMRQRLGVARCLIHDPTILLLDEPASGLDPQSRAELREILRELSNLHKTILISSHILPELADICTHLGIMHKGSLVTEGAVQEILRLFSTGANLRVRLLDVDNREVAIRVLGELPGCIKLRTEKTSDVVVEFAGTDHDRAATLGQLVAAGVQVTEFTWERPSLEEIFLQAIGMEEATA